MGIADRDYSKTQYRGGRGGSVGGFSRPSFRPGNLSVIAWLIIINVGVFAVDQVLPLVELRDSVKVLETATQEQLDRAVVVDRDNPHGNKVGKSWSKPIVDPQTGTQLGVEQYRTWHLLNGFGHYSLLKGFMHYEVWRVVSYQFLHANLSHLFFNMFGLFMFGSMVEQYLGKKRFLSFYLICGIGGGLLYMLFVALAAFNFPLPGTLALTAVDTPLIGASAGVFGVIVACAKIYPDQPVYLLLMPFPLKLKWLAYGYVGLAVYNLVNGGQNAGGDAAHIGGAIAGFYFIRNIHLLRGFLDFGIGPSSASTGGHPRPRKDAGSHRKLQKQADAVLDKVSREGIHSLTAREKKILERSSRD
jgi:membrane associated rhomboid family serine protease